MFTDATNTCVRRLLTRDVSGAVRVHPRSGAGGAVVRRNFGSFAGTRTALRRPHHCRPAESSGSHTGGIRGELV